MKAVLFGATRGIGRAVARRLAARGDALFLMGRDPSSLERSARDLEARGAATPVGVARCDLRVPGGFAPALDLAERELDGLDAVVVSAGLYASQERLEQDPALAAELLSVDFAHTVLFCEEVRRRLLARSGGTLCVFSSVAGERARKPVVLYGAAKAGLSHYLEGLDHRYRGHGLKTLCVKPGFVRTGMTAGLPEPPFAGEPDAVAGRVVRALDRGRAELYAPAIWRAVMLGVRALPRAVLRRTAF